MKRFSQTPIAFSVCRVCLAFDIKMYSLGPQTTEIFEKITKTKIHPEDGKPQAVCYICFSLLKRCLLFANMSHLAEGILMQILRTNPILTRQLVTQHTECIVSFFYSTPIVASSISDEDSYSENITTTSIVKGSVITTYTNRQPVTTEHVTTDPVTFEHVTIDPVTFEHVTAEPVTFESITTEPVIKTVYINEDQIMLETPDLNIKKEPEYIMENESNILMTSSITKEIVTNDPVTVKTEKIDEDQVIVETQDVNMNKEQESISEKESNIFMNIFVTKEIVTNDLVTVKTEIKDEDQDIVETSEVNIKQEQESTSENESDNDIGLITNVTYKEFKNEQLILVENQTEEQEVDLEQIVTQIAQNIENEKAVFGDEISNEPDIKQDKDSTDQIQLNDKIKISKDKDKDKPPINIKQDIGSTDHNIPQTIRLNDKKTSIIKDTTDHKNKEINTSKDKKQSNEDINTNNPDKRKLDDLISELTQEIEDGINAIENEELEQSETDSDCIIVSDEDEEMLECDESDVTIIEEDNETQELNNKAKHKKAKLL